MAKIKGWEKIGDVSPPKFTNMYGLKGKRRVLWIDNWSYGNYAVIIGQELKAPKGSFAKYKEESIYFNGNKKDALRLQMEYMRSHPNG